ncbi:MAG: helix-hairpin-helix domain-containing protein [Chloroflexota bacterium]
MSGDRSTRNALAAILLVAALFVAMNRLVSGAALIDWWLPLVLAVLGLFLVLAPRLEFRRSRAAADEQVELALPATAGEVHTYRVSPPAPRLHTMTIRPDYESAEYTEAAPVVEGVLPFADSSEAGATPKATPVSPETPAPLIEPQPAPESAPMSPETPTPAVEPAPEAVPMSPETPTPAAKPEPEVDTEVVSEGPSQKLPVDRTVDTGAPAADLKFTARTEYANPDAAVAKREPAPAPQADTSVTATEHSEPEKQVVADTMSAPQQPRDAEQVGMITPERAERIMDDSSDNAHDTDVPIVTESASPRVTAQEVNGEGIVGSADDLVKLDGIGPKIAAALKAAGIDSFQKLANTSDDTLRSAVSSAGVRLIGDVDTWAHQAGYAARGDWEGLERFNRERKSGRRG